MTRKNNNGRRSRHHKHARKAASDAPASTELGAVVEVEEALADVSQLAEKDEDGSIHGQSPTTSSSLKRCRPDDSAEDEWEVVEHASKKKKKNKCPSITFSNQARLFSPVKLQDVRDLVLYIQADGTGPNWVSVSHRHNMRKVVVVMVPGLEQAMFLPGGTIEEGGAGSAGTVDPVPTVPTATDGPDAYYPRQLDADTLPESLRPFAAMFPLVWPVRNSGDDKGMRMFSPVQTFLTAPAPKWKDKGGQISGAKEPQGWKDVRTRVTDFIATVAELEDNGFLAHPALAAATTIDGVRVTPPKLPNGWVATRVERLEDADVAEAEIEHGSVTAGRKVLAIDCEMCKTGEEEYSLTRISIVDWSGEVVMDELVLPDKPIVDYLTPYSGITREMLEPVKTTLADVQARLLDLITPRAILVGHSLDSDLKAMQLTHPFIVDTSLLFPHPRGPPLKSSLKYLSQKYLGREIQKGHGTGGHNSVEDARACLDLARQKCEKGKLWGISDMQGENLFRRLARAGVSAGRAQAKTAAAGNVPEGTEIGRTSVAVDWGDPSKGPGGGATHTIGCRSDADVVRGVIRAVVGDADGLKIRHGGVDFVWARMRELETLKGWWNRNRIENGDVAPPTLSQLGLGGDGSPLGEGEGGVEAAATAASRESRSSEQAEQAERDGRNVLEKCLAAVSANLLAIYDALPPGSVFIVLSGSGDPTEMGRLQALHARFRKEYNSPAMKWDQLSVKWTDEEEQALRTAVKRARAGVGFISVK